MTGTSKVKRVLSNEGRRRVAEEARKNIQRTRYMRVRYPHEYLREPRRTHSPKQKVFGESREDLYHHYIYIDAYSTIASLCRDYASAGLLSQEFLAELMEEQDGLEQDLGERVRVQIKRAADVDIIDVYIPLKNLDYSQFSVPKYYPSEESLEEYKERLITYLSETIRRTQERVYQLEAVKEHMAEVSDDVMACLDDIGSRLGEALGEDPSQQGRKLGLEYIRELKSAARTYGSDAEGRVTKRLSQGRSTLESIYTTAGAVPEEETEAVARAAVESVISREYEGLKTQKLRAYLEDNWVDILAAETSILKRMPWPLRGRYRINEDALTDVDAPEGVMHDG